MLNEPYVIACFTEFNGRINLYKIDYFNFIVGKLDKKLEIIISSKF